MNHLIDFGVCALAGSTSFIVLHNYFKKKFKCIFGCSILMLHSKSPIIRRKSIFSSGVLNTNKFIHITLMDG